MASNIVIKLNNFALYGSSSCILPYLTVHILRYANATKSDVGAIMATSAVLGSIVSLLVCSIADRHKAHRKIYLVSLIIETLSFGLLIVPILKQLKLGQNPCDINVDPSIERDETSRLIVASKVENLEPAFEPPCSEPRPTWYYIEALCAIIGTIAITINMSLCDSFSTNAAARHGATYGSLRFWGAVGWVSVTSLLVLADKFPSLPFLFHKISIFIVISILNVLLILLWPDEQPFNLSESIGEDNRRSRGTVFTFSKRILFGHKTLASFEDEINYSTGKPTTTSPVRLITANAKTSFDEDPSRNIRRCSMAVPIKNSPYTMKQFELDGPSCGHFKYVSQFQKNPQLSAISPCGINNVLCLDPIDFKSSKASKFEPGSESIQDTNEHFDWTLHLRIIRMIADKDGLFKRFLFLYVINGFTIAMNWQFFGPYIHQLDPAEFDSIISNVMIAMSLAETVFYHFSPYITKTLDHSLSFSLILIIYWMRYTFYLALGVFDWLPIKLVILVEVVLCVNKSWFDCLFNESALRFALKAKDCTPELISKGLIHNTQESIDQVTNGFKVSMVGLSSTCFDGLGVGLGSLVGGLIIDRCGFESMWFMSGSIAALVAFYNGHLWLADWLRAPTGISLGAKSGELKIAQSKV